MPTFKSANGSLVFYFNAAFDQRLSYGEENVGKLTIANISYSSESG